MRGAVTRALRWADPRPRRIGRRGLFLAFLAFLDAVIGFSLLEYPAPALPSFPHSQYPLFSQPAWAVTWLAVAGICASGILARRDRVQYAAAATLFSAWSVRYAYLWVLGFPFAWEAFTIWAAFAIIVLIISSWPEALPKLPGVPPLPPGVPPLPPDGAHDH